MRLIRQAVVSGSFYPSSPVILRQQIREYFDKTEVDEYYDDVLGIIVPHGSYIFSGACAAHAYKSLKKFHFDTAVILAPRHKEACFNYSVGNFDAYATPLGKIRVNKKLADEILTDPLFDFIPQAHKAEYSLEVQLPFIQMVNPEATVLPVLTGNQSPEYMTYLSEKLSSIYKKSDEKILFVISTDLSHYKDSATVAETDNKLLETIKKGDVTGLSRDLRSKAVEACGGGGIAMMMKTAQKFNARFRLLDYRHSGLVSKKEDLITGYFSGIYYK